MPSSAKRSTPSRVGHRLEIAHPAVEATGRRRPSPTGRSRARRSARRCAAPRQLAQQVAPDRAVPVVLQVRQPGGRLDQRRPAAGWWPRPGARRRGCAQSGSAASWRADSRPRPRVQHRGTGRFPLQCGSLGSVLRHQASLHDERRFGSRCALCRAERDGACAGRARNRAQLPQGHGADRRGRPRRHAVCVAVGPGARVLQQRSRPRGQLWRLRRRRVPRRDEPRRRPALGQRHHAGAHRVFGRATRRARGLHRRAAGIRVRTALQADPPRARRPRSAPSSWRSTTCMAG